MWVKMEDDTYSCNVSNPIKPLRNQMASASMNGQAIAVKPMAERQTSAVETLEILFRHKTYPVKSQNKTYAGSL
jgi:hypothetical protein